MEIKGICCISVCPRKSGIIVRGGYLPAPNASQRISQTYSFTYDSFGNKTSVKVGNKTLATYEYAPNNGNLTKMTYGNGDTVVFDGDTLKPVTNPKYIATYNYSPLYEIPQSGAGIVDYSKFVDSAVGHFFLDMLPYYMTGNSNTRAQFEEKISVFN